MGTLRTSDAMNDSHPSLRAFDDIVIDLEGRRLLRAGQVQPLEPKAFGVLELLTGSPGHVFSREEILDAVWGHRHVTPGVLNRIMTLLRHALGEDAQSPRYLHTVHGYGYRFDLLRPGATPPQDGKPKDSQQINASSSPARRRGDRMRASHRPRRVGPRMAVAAIVLVAMAGLLMGWRW